MPRASRTRPAGGAAILPPPPKGPPEQICLCFVLGRPQNPSLMSAYETAKAILSRARFATDVVDENDVDDLVASIKREYFSH